MGIKFFRGVKMIKKLIKLFHKTRKINQITREQFLYTMTFEEQNSYCRLHNISFKEVINNLK